MLKETRKYIDFDGNERTEDFYFNFTKAELIEMNLFEAGGMAKMIERIINANDPGEIMRVFKELILRSYGEKSPDGRTFMKSPEISARFAATPVYSDMFMEFSQDADKAVAFVKGLVPPDILPEIEKREKEGTLLQHS